jgi:penicillin-binding protein 2
MANTSLNNSSGFASKERRIAFYVIIGLFGALFIGRLAQLQILQGSTLKQESDAQAIKQIRVVPYRGNMYDREEKLIVKNEGSYTITLTPIDFKNESLPLLTKILGIDSTQIYKEINSSKYYSKFSQIKIYRDASHDIVAQIEEYNHLLPGIDVLIESKRLYDFEANMAHILGYTREISAEQIEDRPYYKPGDIIGQTGLEKSYERELKGQEGYRWVAVNTLGQRVASFDNGKNDINAQNGFDLFLSIDIDLQKKAEELLEGKRGSIVAIDVNSGEIIAVASKPDFDPRDFTGRIPAELYRSLSNDEGKPLFHRAVMAQYPPGSTWKMLIALAGLQEGIIDENSTFLCVGGYNLGSHFINCHGSHGNISLRRAIQTSCNAYFNQLAIKLGIEKFAKYGEMFGFGRDTKIDLPNEFDGLLPTREYLEKRYGKNGVSKGRLANFGIGQGEVLATPMQMAVYTAMIANSGKHIQPHLVKGIYNNYTHKKELIDYKEEYLPIDKKHFKIVKKAMFDVVNSGGGTAGAARISEVKVCGKTGTAENPHGKDHAWFVSFAPYENPEIALVVFVENAGFGGSVSAPIAKKFYRSYFKLDTIKTEPEIIDEFPIDSTQIVEN